MKHNNDFVFESMIQLNKRYEVPLEVPVVEKKAEMTDYDVVVKSNPFSLLITRKSTGVTL